MQYFGFPRCPYCNKRVNLIRTWSLKKQGEYKCPRCNGISNIYQSPLIWVFAALAIFSSLAIYFFYKFIIQYIDLKSVLYIFMPFALFFIVSLFLIYLKKPVIKKVNKSKKEVKNDSVSTSKKHAHVQTVFDQRKEPLPLQIAEEANPDIDAKIFGLERQIASESTSNTHQKNKNNMASEIQGLSNTPLNQAEDDLFQDNDDIELSPPIDITQTLDIKASNQRSVASIEISDDFFAKYDNPEYIKKRLQDEEKNN